MAQCTTTKGIVSLYNKGFVPKRTGKVNNRSRFAASKHPLYKVYDEEKSQPISHEDRNFQKDLSLRSLTENDDLEYSDDAPSLNIDH